MYKQEGRTLPCKICGKPYTDRIDPRVDPDKGGYIICAKCTMGMADGYKLNLERGSLINPMELLEAVRNCDLKKYRLKYGLTQRQLGKKLGITTRHLRRMEESSYISNAKTIRKIEKKLKKELEMSPLHTNGLESQKADILVS